MSGLYDRLNDRLDDNDDDASTGLTPLEIAELPAAQRRVMFALLRDSTASTEGLPLDALQAMFAGEDLTQTLEDLTQAQWLIRMGEPPHERYKVNLRRRRGSSLGANLWGSLNARLSDLGDDDGDDDAPDSPPPSRKPRLGDW